MSMLNTQQQVAVLAAIFRLKGYRSPFRLMPMSSHQVLSNGTLEKCLHEYITSCERRKRPIDGFRLASDVRLGTPQQVYRLEFELAHNAEDGFRVNRLTVHSMYGVSKLHPVNGTHNLPNVQQLLPPVATNQRQRLLPPPLRKRRGL